MGPNNLASDAWVQLQFILHEPHFVNQSLQLGHKADNAFPTHPGISLLKEKFFAQLTFNKKLSS